jgi:hypothetical protein
MAKMSPPRRRMIEDMTLCNLSRQTHQSYFYAVAKLSRRFNRPLDQFGMQDVSSYQLHLVGQKYSCSVKYSWTHVNQVAFAYVSSIIGSARVLLCGCFRSRNRWYEIIGNPTLANAILDRVVDNAYRCRRT